MLTASWLARLYLLRGGCNGKFGEALSHARASANKQASVVVDGKILPLFAVNYAYIMNRTLRLMKEHRQDAETRSRNLRDVLAAVAREQDVSELWDLYYKKSPCYSDFVNPEYTCHSKRLVRLWCEHTGKPRSEYKEQWSGHSLIPKKKGVQKWITCPIPHPAAQHSAKFLLETYDALEDKCSVSKVVVGVLKSDTMREQLKQFIQGFKKNNLNKITWRADHLRKYKELYTAIITATAADSQTTVKNESCFSTTTRCKCQGC